ncbi:MAG: amino acid permease [Flavobacteriales bacterium]|nr:amino acid permease [Flavobacteriales bacterium]
MSHHRKRNKSLGLTELIAIALGGMVGGGIFTILGISVAMIGNLTPVAILIGGLIAFLAAYSYVQLGLFYKDEGATYSFYKRTYPNSRFSASVIGWFIIFGYISTLALYAYTFSSYAISNMSFSNIIWIKKTMAVVIIGVFSLINIWSVNGVGKTEDIMVYTKIIVLLVISIILIKHGTINTDTFIQNIKEDLKSSSLFAVLIVSSLTFVAYEGFQLVIHAMDEMENPAKNIPRAIYSSIIIATTLYFIISTGALFAIPIQDIIENKEYALAAGANNILGKTGTNLVILGAILATSSAISGTVFGSSRLLSVIAKDGYFPLWLSQRKDNIPKNAIILIACLSSILIIIGGLELILEFGSITFLLVSLLMAIANYKMRELTNSSKLTTILAIIGLSIGGILILYYEFTNEWTQMLFIIFLYALLTVCAWWYSFRRKIKI